jgi:hypothetical protein
MWHGRRCCCGPRALMVRLSTVEPTSASVNGCRPAVLQNFRQIAAGIDIAPALAELDAQPELWNSHPERRGSGSPHEGVDDIWLRYRPKAELTEPARYLEPFIPAFYPEWYALPSLRPVVMALMAAMDAVQLGGLLMTRIPAGGQVKPHHDRGSWHAEFFNCKVYVPLRANLRCVNYSGVVLNNTLERVVMRQGEAWTFDNQVFHSVENKGDTERITLIICLRCEP